MKHKVRTWLMIAGLIVEALGCGGAIEMMSTVTPVPTATPSSTAMTAMALSVIPYSDPDYVAPGRGAHYWLGTEGALAVQLPISGQPEQTLDRFERYKWSQIESDTGVFSWSLFDSDVKAAINAGQKFAFGISSLCPPLYCSNLTVVNGVSLSYPLYVHNQIQAESVKDWTALNTAEGSFWIPNWNSTHYLSAWSRLLNAIAAHIETSTFNGIRFKDAIAWVDVRGFGTYGEWHNYPWDALVPPAGTTATASSLISIIDASKNAFPNFQLVGLLGTFAATSINSQYIIPPQVSCYLAQTRNNYGEIGWRRDNWGTNASWLAQYVESNPIVCSGGALLKDLIMNKWKTAPITGEPNGSASTAASGGDCAFYDLEREVRFYHASSFGNGNWGGAQSQTCAQNYIRAASKATGYRLQVNAGSYSPVVGIEKSITIKLAFRNTGIAPTYENWNVNYELKNNSGTVVWSGISSMVLKLYLPESSDRNITDQFTIPQSIPAGNYSLNLVIREPSGYRKPLPLANTGRALDGSYFLGSIRVE